MKLPDQTPGAKSCEPTWRKPAVAGGKRTGGHGGSTEGRRTGADLRRGIVADARNLWLRCRQGRNNCRPSLSSLEKVIRQLEKHREQLAAPAFTAVHHRGASTKGWVKPVCRGERGSG